MGKYHQQYNQYKHFDDKSWKNTKVTISVNTNLVDNTTEMFCTYNPLVKLGIFFSIIRMKSGASYQNNTVVSIASNNVIKPQYHTTFDYPICMINRNGDQEDITLYINSSLEIHTYCSVVHTGPQHLYSVFIAPLY